MLNDISDVEWIGHVTEGQLDPLQQIAEIDAHDDRLPASEPHHAVTALQQVLSKQDAVLTSDARDERGALHAAGLLDGLGHVHALALPDVPMALASAPVRLGRRTMRR